VASPDDLRPWTDGGVVVLAQGTLPASCRPALVGSMLVQGAQGGSATAHWPLAVGWQLNR
jgi:hypothetical protein